MNSCSESQNCSRQDKLLVVKVGKFCIQKGSENSEKFGKNVQQVSEFGQRLNEDREKVSEPWTE